MKNLCESRFPLKGGYVAMLAPSFIVDFSYPEIIHGLKELGFSKVVELTFGAKLVNREYHKFLKNKKSFFIASVCPGIVDLVCKKFPKYRESLIPVDSPMIAMGKICRKTFPEHKIVFISPCNYKKIEASNSKYIDFVIDYRELKEIFYKNKIKLNKNSKVNFDRFYNDYTKIYPLSGGLSKTAHLKGVVSRDKMKKIDGVAEVIKFLNKPSKEIIFFDCNFCKGGCIGGPCINSKDNLTKRKKEVLDYLELSKREDIPESRKGLFSKAKGISFFKKY